ncbi:MAG: acetyl-CoA hydrolase/transferase C-terminal domain-containing protein [Steroidobacteraceae bacterium]
MSATHIDSISTVASRLRPGMTVFVPGMSGESVPFFEALQRSPAHAEGVTFVGIHYPGLNRDYLSLHASARFRGYFMTPPLRKGLAEGRVDLMPLDYPGVLSDLESGVRIDAVIVQVSPPDTAGLCSLGASYDFAPSVWSTAHLRIAHINPRLPRTRGSCAIRLQDCTHAFEADSDLPTLAREPVDATSERIAANVASLVPDGATLQFGIGRLQTAILSALKTHRGLRVYSGMVTPGVLTLLEAGALASVPAVETGVALGDASFYAQLHEHPAFYFRPVSETHDVRRLAALPTFCAINSGLDVDLFGQVQADHLDGRLIAGVGGLPAYCSGARLSSGGRSIIALPSTAAGGRTSRITAGKRTSLVALRRHEADYVVTEHGVATLRSRSITERARALIAIAAPEFRESLAAEWHEIQRSL